MNCERKGEKEVTGKTDRELVWADDASALQAADKPVFDQEGRIICMSMWQNLATGWRH